MGHKHWWCPCHWNILFWGALSQENNFEMMSIACVVYYNVREWIDFNYVFSYRCRESYVMGRNSGSTSPKSGFGENVFLFVCLSVVCAVIYRTKRRRFLIKFSCVSIFFPDLGIFSGNTNFGVAVTQSAYLFWSNFVSMSTKRTYWSQSLPNIPVCVLSEKTVKHQGCYRIFFFFKIVSTNFDKF